MKELKTCRCGRSNKMHCPRCSKVRMVILLKNGNDQLKYQSASGHLNNPVWYSFLKYNRYDIYTIAEKMEYRLRNHSVYNGAAQVLQFYINGNRGHAFKEIKL